MKTGLFRNSTSYVTRISAVSWYCGQTVKSVSGGKSMLRSLLYGPWNSFSAGLGGTRANCLRTFRDQGVLWCEKCKCSEDWKCRTTTTTTIGTGTSNTLWAHKRLILGVQRLMYPLSGQIGLHCLMPWSNVYLELFVWIAILAPHRLVVVILLEELKSGLNRTWA